MSKPLVSVITPVHNGEEWIADCINSVARSVHNDEVSIEHIIVDDGSDDDTIEVAMTAAHVRLIPYRVQLIHYGTNVGKPSAVRNRGIEAAKGKYVFCLDCDDVILQNAIRYLAAHMEGNGDQIVYGDFIRTDVNLNYIIGNDYWGWPHATKEDAIHSIFRGDHFYQHSMMFTKSLWAKIGGYDETITYGEDLDLCIRFIMDGFLPHHLPIVTHLHRNHRASLTAGYKHRSDIWLAERRAHYHKHQTTLQKWLTPKQIADVERQLEITAETHLNGPPVRTAAPRAVNVKNLKL